MIRPFTFRESLRHRGEEPESAPIEWSSAQRSAVERRFLEYLDAGGFPEAQGLAAQLRVGLLQGYVDTVLFRDVVERYGVSQVSAPRWVTRHCLRSAAGSISVHRLHRDLSSQGLGVAKDAVGAMLGHLGRCVPVDDGPAVVFNELARRRGDIGYVKTGEGFEADFLVQYQAGSELIQVCADPSEEKVLEREVRVPFARPWRSTGRPHPRSWS